MKSFLIQYKFKLDAGSVDAWHEHVRTFISALENDAELKGRITYRCMKAKEGSAYYHLAEASDDEVPKILSQRDYFKRYTEETNRVGGGEVVVSPLETVAATK